MTETRVTLTPIERLRLREALQDRWRDQVRLITELAVDLHEALDGDEEAADNDVTTISVALSAARLRLSEIEQAMRRLDDRSYGRCFACLIPLPYQDLVEEPDARHCGDCRHVAAATGMTVAVASAG